MKNNHDSSTWWLENKLRSMPPVLLLCEFGEKTKTRLLLIRDLCLVVSEEPPDAKVLTMKRCCIFFKVQLGKTTSCLSFAISKASLSDIVSAGEGHSQDDFNVYHKYTTCTPSTPPQVQVRHMYKVCHASWTSAFTHGDLKCSLSLWSRGRLL